MHTNTAAAAKKRAKSPSAGYGNTDELDVLGAYFQDMEGHRLLTREQEQDYGRRIKESRDVLLNKALGVKTKYMPFRDLQRLIKAGMKDNSRVSIDRIVREIDRRLSELDELDRPPRELVEFRRIAARLRAEMVEASGYLVQGNLRLAVVVAKRFRGLGLPLSDLIQEANCGLLKAALRYDPETGNRFSTYAVWWIRQSLHMAVAQSAGAIRLPAKVHENTVKYHRALTALTNRLGREPDSLEVAEESGLDLSVVEAIEQAPVVVASLNCPVGDEDAEMVDFIVDDNSETPLGNVENLELHHKVALAMERLEERDRKILMLRYGLAGSEVHTLEQLGQVLNISRERVRQLEMRAVRRVRASVEGAAALN